MRSTFPLAIAISVAFAGCVAQKPGTGPAAAAAQQASAGSQSTGLPPVDMAAAQRILTPDETLQTLDFPEAGTKTLSGRVEGYKTAVYALPIRKGQRLEVTMDTKSTGAYFNIVDAKDTSGTALFAGEMAGTNTGLVRATDDATYVLRPYLNRAAARRGQKADYTFKIERQ